MAAVAIEVLREAAKRVGIPEDQIDKLLKIAKQARDWADKLSEQLIDFYYKRPEGRAIRQALSLAANISGWSKHMEEVMRDVAPELERRAKEAKLCSFYRLIWGKSIEGCPEYA